jgi:hypothetical protein
MKSKQSLRTVLCSCILFSLLVFVFCISAPLALAQSTGGRIRGTVTDATGGTIAAAKPTITNQANGLQRETETGANGEYIFLEVPVGTYEIQLSQPGFKKYVHKGVVVNLNEVVGVDIVLQVGGSTEIVEVTGTPPLVDTTSTQLGAVVGERAVSELPLAQRDTYQLLQLQPGVQSQLGVDSVYGSDRAGVVSVNGGRGRDNNYTVNGGDGNDQFANLPAIQPSPDSIAEFRVLTNTFDAEYGRNSGAVVNVVTKSGGNDFHGNAYEFFRNKDLNAQGYFDSEKLDYLQNQFGATFGGPIKKDKTFFFVSYEGNRIRKGTSGDTVAVPSLAEQGGDFSGGSQFGGTLTNASILNNRPGCLTALGRDTTPIADGTAYSTVFPTNIIPTACMDQTALALMQEFVPAPNASDGSNFFQGVPLGHERSNQFSVKIDHELTKSQHLNGYYYFTQHFLEKPFARFQAGGGNLPGFGDLTDERVQQVNLSHTWTVSPTSVNEARFTFFRQGQGTFLHPQLTNSVNDSCTLLPNTANVTPETCFNDPNNPGLGIQPGLGPSREGVPFVNISGGAAFGNNFEGELPQTGNTFQWSDNFSKVIGNHSIKFGGDVRYQRFDQRLFFDISGQFLYFGGGPNDVGFDDLYPNYLLGLPDQYLQGSAQDELVRSKSVYLFAQDSWKLKPNVTLNYGLRWELNTPLADAGQRVQTFRPGETSTVYGQCQLSQASIDRFTQFGVTDPDCNNTGIFPTGLLVPGDPGVPKGLVQTYYKSFAPRIGLAWSPGYTDGFLGKVFGGPGKSSVRMGFGIFYNPVEQLVLEQFSAEPPFGGSSNLLNTQFNTPFAFQDPSSPSAPNPFNGILDPPRNQPIDWSVYRPILLFGQFPKELRPQYAEQYNFGIERELVKDLVLTVTYVGRQGHRLLASQDINPGTKQTCLDLHAISNSIGDPNLDCGAFFADSSFFIQPGTTLPVDLHLPYGSTPVVPAGTVVGPNGISLVGLRPFSSPNCDPVTGTSCPPDGIPVFSSIFTQRSLANSAYNALQVGVEKRFSYGLQFQASYTYSKSIDLASTFENLVDPFDPSINRSLSLFDARHRFVFSYYWQLPIRKYEGIAGKLLNGWAISGITTFQSGFPIRITSQDDTELQSSFDFETPGRPNLVASFKSLDPRKQICASGTGTDPSTCTLIHAGFDPNSFNSATCDPTIPDDCTDNPGTVPLGTIGNAPRTICCGPGLNNWEFGFTKDTPIGERYRLQFRGELFNAFNHPQFFQPDGNTTDGEDFGRVKRARDPRLVQFALKFYF